MMRGSQSSCRRLVLTYHKETLEFANFAKGQFELVQCASLDGFSVLMTLSSFLSPPTRRRQSCRQEDYQAATQILVTQVDGSTAVTSVEELGFRKWR